MLRGSQAALVPLRTCLLSRLNSPKISCLFSHRNVSVITLFPCFCTFLDAGAAQDVPNLAGCLSCWGKEIAFPCLQLCQSLTPPKLGNKKIPAEESFASKSGLFGHRKKPPAAWKTGADKGEMRKTGKSSETTTGGAGAKEGMGGGGNVTGVAQPRPWEIFLPARCLASLPCTCYTTIPKHEVSKGEVGQIDGTMELEEHPMVLVILLPRGMQESCPRRLQLPSTVHQGGVSCSPNFLSMGARSPQRRFLFVRAG